MTAKKRTSRSSAGKNDGKGKQDPVIRAQKLTAKYTIVRAKEDLKKIDIKTSWALVRFCYQKLLQLQQILQQCNSKNIDV